MRVADAIWKRIEQEVDTIFYVAGGGCSFLVDALGQSKLRAVACLHEQGAGYTAVGYAQHRGFGVCLVTSGPGVTNAITPCLAAWLDSVPVLFISGQVTTEWLASAGMRSRGTQEAPTIEMVKPITKLAWQMNIWDLLMLDIHIKTAKLPRCGPVWLSIPQDVQAATI